MKRKIKIHMVTPSISRLYTGVSEITFQLSKKLHEKEIKTNIFTMEDQYTDIDIKKWDVNSKINVYKPYGPNIIGFNPNILNDMMDNEGDAGHIQALWSYNSYALSKWSKKKKKPYMLSSNGYLDEWALNNSKYKKKLALALGFQDVIKNASCIQVNSEKELIALRNIGVENPIAIIQNGVMIEENNRLKQDPPWKDVDSTNGKNILLYLSRIHPKKGVDILLAAWKKMITEPSMRSWHLVIVGFNKNEDQYERKCVNYVEVNNLENSVTMLGGFYDDKMMACYQNCDAYILPSFSEGNPIAALNAMAFSKPVLITKECNIPIIDTKEIGIKLEPSIESIALSLYKLSKLNKKNLEEMGKKGFNYIKDNQSWELISGKYRDVYDWMINKEENTAFIDTIK